MKTLPLLSLGLMAAASLVPFQTAEARRDDKKHGQERHFRHRHHHHHHHYPRHHYPRYQRPRSGFSLYFNVAPQPTYVVPVRPAAVYGRSVVVQVQSALNRRGYSAGVVDGVAGPRTRNALVAFQADAGLRPSGQIDEPTLRALGLM